MTKIFLRAAAMVMAISAIASCKEGKPMPQDSADSQDMTITESTVWESSRYSAFTDIIHFGSRYYCAFREAGGHVTPKPEDRGSIIIRSSEDCQTWKTELEIVGPNDLRDPHFMLSNDSTRVFVYYGMCVPTGNDATGFPNPCNQMCELALDASGDLKLVCTHDVDLRNGTQDKSQYWLWGVREHGGSYYGIAYYYYDKGRPTFFRSEDGVHFEQVSEVPVKGNEASICFIDERAYIFFRSVDKLDAIVTYSDPPYDNWESHIQTYEGMQMHCPETVCLWDKILVCMRGNTHGVPIYVYDPKDGKFEFVHDVFDNNTTDRAYPGMIAHDGAMHVSYYAYKTKAQNIYHQRIPLAYLKEQTEIALSQARKERPELKFRQDGTFKIAQFTDTHIRTTLPQEADAVYARMDYIVETEHPDLIVLTGDNVTVKPAAPEWERLVSKLDSYRIPWCVVMGNHDSEQDLTRPEMAALVTSGKYSMNLLNSKLELADMELSVLASTGSEAADVKGNSFYVFCLDSHADTTLDGKGCYDWFTTKQVQWLRNRCLARTDENGNVAQSLAFFHIPLREYIDAWADRDDPREGASTSAKTLGIRGECICCAELNTGMFAAMKETGSVVGMSVGHDHDNDFAAAYHGIAMCYGRYSGANTVTNHLPGGARIFQVKEGARGFESWIREDSGRVLWHMAFDGEKIIKAPRDRSKAFGTWFEVPQVR